MADLKTQYELGETVQQRSSGIVGRVRRIVPSYLVRLDGGREVIIVEPQLQRYPLTQITPKE